MGYCRSNLTSRLGSKKARPHPLPRFTTVPGVDGTTGEEGGETGVGGGETGVGDEMVGVELVDVALALAAALAASTGQVGPGRFRQAARAQKGSAVRLAGGQGGRSRCWHQCCCTSPALQMETGSR